MELLSLFLLQPFFLFCLNINLTAEMFSSLLCFARGAAESSAGSTVPVWPARACTYITEIKVCECCFYSSAAATVFKVNY